VEGSGIGPDLRVVALVCVSAQRPLLVAWRLREGDASEKGKEASVTRGLVEQALWGARGACACCSPMRWGESTSDLGHLSYFHGRWWPGRAMGNLYIGGGASPRWG